MELNFKEAFTFMFKDEKFKSKYAIGGVLLLLITVVSNGIIKEINYPSSLVLKIGLMLIYAVLFMLSFGYTCTFVNNKITTNSNELPEWKSNIWNFIKISLKYFVGMLSYLVLIAVFYFLLVIDFFIVAQYPNIWTIALFFLFAFFIIVLLIVLCFAVCSFYTDLKISSFFNFKKMWMIIKRNVLNFILSFLVFALYGMITSLIAKLPYSQYILCVFSLIVSFYLLLAMNHLTAQFIQLGLKKNTQPKEEQE